MSLFKGSVFAAAMVLGLAWQASPSLAAEAPRIGPPPAWVRAPPETPAERDEVKGLPVTVLLNDMQVSFDADGWTEFHEVKIKVQTQDGLQAVGSIPYQWSPWSDTLTFHHADILRDGETINVLPKDGVFTVLRREAGLERAMLTGVLTAVLQPEGLQVGDVLDFSVSVRHADPLLKGKVGALIAGWDAAPTGRVRLEVQWPASLAVKWKQTSDLPPLKPSTANGVTTVGFTLDNVRPPVLPAHAPTRFQHGKQVEFTTLADWTQVVRQMAPLYEKASQLEAQSPVAAQAKLIAAASSDPKSRVMAALRLVQEKVRYLAHAEAGGGLEPQSADETWRLRYGDCKAKTVLLLALLRELGVPAEPVLASIGAGDGVAAHLPNISLFDHVIVRVKLGGRDYWIDGARQGDRDLDAIAPPLFGWVLPLGGAEGRLVRIVQPPFDRPQFVQIIRYDASGGVTEPEPTHLETVFRGDAAIQVHSQVSAIPPDRTDAFLKAYWANVHTAFTPTHLAATWDPETGEERFTAEGTSKLDWSGSGLELQHVALGGAPDIKRDPASADPEAPYIVDFPSYVETDESVVLPAGDIPSAESLNAAKVDLTAGGVAYHRVATLEGGVFRVVASARALVSEISAADARASVEPLTALGAKTVYVSAGAQSKAADDASWIDSHPVTADDHRHRGNALLDRLRFKEAIAEFDSAIALDPTSQLAWAGRAVAHAWLGDDAATADADKADSLGAPEVVAAHARAIFASRKGDNEGARAAYRRALTIAPGDEFSLRQLLDLDAQASDFVTAEKDLDDLSKAHPELAKEIHLMRARIERYAHHDEAAEKELSQAPTDTASDRIARAVEYRALGKPDLEGQDVEAAYRLAPHDLSVQEWMLSMATRRGDDAGALRLFDPILNDHQDRVGELLIQRAAVEARLGRAAAVDADLEHARAMEGVGAPSAFALCNGEVGIKWRPDTALEDCEKALKASPDNLSARMDRVTLLHRLGRIAESEKALAGVESSTKKFFELNSVCYTLAVEDIELDHALADCDAALKLSPHQVDTLDSRAFVLLRLGRDTEALAAYNAVLDSDPDMFISLYGRAIVEKRLGRVVDSAKDMSRALAADPSVKETFAKWGFPDRSSRQGRPRPLHTVLGFKQPLAHEPAGPRPGRTGEEAAADVGDELVQHVELGHVLENLHEARARVALVADEEQPRIQLHPLAPGRPALGDEGEAIVIGIGAAEDLGAPVHGRRPQAHMGILRDHRVSVRVDRVEVQRVGFAGLAERRAGDLVAAHGLFLEAELHPVPVLQGDADRAGDQIAAAAHPAAFIADPDDVVHQRRIAGRRVHGAILETHEIARRLAGLALRREPGLHPAELGDAVGQARQGPHGMESHLGIVRAGLDGEISARPRGDQLVAIESRQIDQGLGAPRRQAITILAILDEKAWPKAEGDRQPRRM